MEVAYFCDRGLEREENEDAILVDEEESLYVVADGMGGHHKGAIASSIVVESFRTTPLFLEEEKLNFFNEEGVKLGLIHKLNKQVEIASKKIQCYATEHFVSELMGTTVVGLYKLPIFNLWGAFHLGDSRLYHLSRSRLTQLTLDHTGAKGVKNSISKAIGNFETLPLEINFFNANKGDIFLLCSDGVSDYCNNEELFELGLRYRYSLPLLCQSVKEFIYKRGAKDNLSLVVLMVEDH